MRGLWGRTRAAIYDAVEAAIESYADLDGPADVDVGQRCTLVASMDGALMCPSVSSRVAEGNPFHYISNQVITTREKL